MSVPVTLSDLERWEAMGQNFLAVFDNHTERPDSLTQSDKMWHGNTCGAGECF